MAARLSNAGARVLRSLLDRFMPARLYLSLLGALNFWEGAGDCFFVKKQSRNFWMRR